MDHTQKTNIFYQFLFAVSLGDKTSKMFENFRLYRKIGFQNTFYTKCINVIIDSIGPSVILRSIFSFGNIFNHLIPYTLATLAHVRLFLIVLHTNAKVH